MPELPPTSISEHFATLTDPRRDHTKEHRLVDIVTITRCPVIGGADDWVAVETFGRAKQAWLRTFLALPGGIPSHDTFGRVFARLDPDEFPALLPGLGPGGRRGARAAGRVHRRQDAAPVARSRRRQGGAAPGQRLGGHQRAGPRPSRH